jgi:hypothetical protein
MQITRPQGIFNIKFDTEKADFEARQNYNKLGFLSAVLIGVIDTLENTTEYRHEFKNLLKNTLKQAEKITKNHFLSYSNYGELDNEGTQINAMDVHNLTADAYEKAFEFMYNRKPHEIVSAMELIRVFEEKGGNLSDVKVEFEPIKD